MSYISIDKSLTLQGSVYLHINNGGVEFSVLSREDKDGQPQVPVIRIGSGHMSNNLNVREVAVTKAGLIALGELFTAAGEAIDDKPGNLSDLALFSEKEGPLAERIITPTEH